MENKKVITKNAKQTQNLGKEFAKKLKKGDTVLLSGDLGSGKTTFMQGVGMALNILERVISPTFVLVRKHKGSLKGENLDINHVDLYRLDNDDQIDGLGLGDILDDKSISFIEWGKKTSTIEYGWEIEFKVVDENTREISFLKNE